MKIKALSLFDGISCGKVALDELGFKVKKYHAYEIDKTAIKISKANHPKIKHKGDVTQCNPKKYYDYDLLIGGSPCQDLSCANSNGEGLGGEKSKMFYEYVRVFEEMIPEFFLFENVGSMSKEDEEIITDIFKVEPIRINSKTLSAMLRDRLYWTNIPFTKIKANLRKENLLNSILIDGYSDRDKARTLLASDSRPLTNPVKMMHRYVNTGFTTLIFKDEKHYLDAKWHFNKNYKGKNAIEIDEIMKSVDNSVYDGVRYMTPIERERCVGLPEGYTSCVTDNQAAHHIGNGWDVRVIKELLKGIKL